MRYLGIDIGGTSIKYGIVNEHGEVTEKAEMPSEIDQGGVALMDKLLEIVDARRNSGLDGVGICTPGVVDIRTKRVIAGANHIRGWYALEQCKIINEAFGLQCVIENDAKSAAIAENWIGAGVPYDCFYMVTFGTGLGGSLVINGSVRHGHNYVAGEVCCLLSAGGDGRYYAATSSLVSIARERFGKPNLSGREFFDEIRNKHFFYEQLLDEWCHYAALPLADIYCTVDPQAIVVGGGISNVADLFLPKLAEKIRLRLGAELGEVFINLVPALLGNDAGTIGAVYALAAKKT